MRLAWVGVVTAGIGLVVSAVLWTLHVTSTGVTAAGTPVCYGRWELEVPCEVLGVDMRWGSFAAVVVFGLSALLAYVAIRSQGRRRPRRDA